MPSSEFIEVEANVRLHIQDWGQGKPIVFIHGWPLSHDMYRLDRGVTKGTMAHRVEQRSTVQWEMSYDYASRPEARAGLHDECRP
jgi:pimeloyl-ACP methyl ester carboxylesterase